MRSVIFAAALIGAATPCLAQTAQTAQPPAAPAPTPEQRAAILQVCTQKADLNPRLLPRDRPKFIADCIDKAKIVE